MLPQNTEATTIIMPIELNGPPEIVPADTAPPQDMAGAEGYGMGAEGYGTGAYDGVGMDAADGRNASEPTHDIDPSRPFFDILFGGEQTLGGEQTTTAPSNHTSEPTAGTSFLLYGLAGGLTDSAAPADTTGIENVPYASHPARGGETELPSHGGGEDASHTISETRIDDSGAMYSELPENHPARMGGLQQDASGAIYSELPENHPVRTGEFSTQESGGGRTEDARDLDAASLPRFDLFSSVIDTLTRIEQRLAAIENLRPNHTSDGVDVGLLRGLLNGDKLTGWKATARDGTTHYYDIHGENIDDLVNDARQTLPHKLMNHVGCRSIDRSNVDPIFVRGKIVGWEHSGKQCTMEYNLNGRFTNVRSKARR